MKKTCDYCGKEFDEDILTQIDNEFVCDDCIDEHFCLCDGCERFFHNDDVTYINDYYYCKDCYDNSTFVCECCNEVHLLEESNNTDDCIICNDCLEENYCYCDECGELISRDSAYLYGDKTYCNSCCDDFMEILGVHAHKYTLKICFHQCDDEDDNRSNNLHVGIELEIQGYDKEDFCKKMKNEYGNEDIFYMKEDGSLNDEEGVEIVSQPMTYNFIKKSSHFSRLFKLLDEYSMNDTCGCGLHFHLDREYCDKDNNNIGSIIDCIVNTFSNFFENVGGRKFNSFCQKSEDKLFGDWGKRNYSRYYAVNFENSNTIELRFCASTYDYKTFMDRVKMIFTIVCFAQKYSLKDVSNMKEDEFIRKFKRMYNRNFKSDSK